jgi:hypothetical protein
MGTAVQIEGTTREAQPSREVQWHLTTCIAFRFVSVFLILFFFPSPFELPSDWVSMISPKIVPWVASHALHIKIPPIRYSGIADGDDAYSVARTLLLLSLSVAVTIAWSIADRKRRHYETAHGWLRLYTRVILGWFMLDYGSWKVVFPDQMRDPTLSTLLVPFGDLSPTARLWLFMGSSQLYTFCCGAVELLGGALLFVPRLASVGAMVCAAALANILLLDVSYDVAVRHLALMMLLMSAFLLAYDLRRIVNVLVLNRSVESRPARPLLARRWLDRAAVAVTILLGCYWLVSDLDMERRNSKAILEKQFKTPYYGVWAVDEFAINGAELPPLFTDPVRWKLIVFDWGPESKPSIVVHFGPGTRRLFFMDFDGIGKSITLTQSKPGGLMSPGELALPPVTRKVGSLIVNDAQLGRLLLEGDFEGQRVRAVLHRIVPAPTVRKWRYRWLHTGPFWGDDIII